MIQQRLFKPGEIVERVVGWPGKYSHQRWSGSRNHSKRRWNLSHP